MAVDEDDEAPRTERSVNDPNNFSSHLRNQLEDVEDLESTADANAIMRWVSTMRTRNGEAAVTTKIGRANIMKLMSQRAPDPLVDFESDEDVTDLLERFKTGEHPQVKDDGLGEGTLRQYRLACRVFFRDELDREWAENIDIGRIQRPPVRPDQILTNEEADALLDAARGDARDRALIAFLLVTGQRITAALSIKLGDVDLDQQTGQIRLNDDAIGLKGASGPRPLLWARPYVATWFEAHPKRGDDTAPLFCATQSGVRHRSTDGEPIRWEVGDPLSRTQAKKRIRDIAEEAGVPLQKVKLHNFRHTAITRMRDQGVPDDRIKFMVGVKPDSDILERYDQADNAKMLKRIREGHGIDPGDAAVGKPTITECPQCTTALRGTESYCPQCTAPLSQGAAEEKEDLQSGLADDMAALSDAEKRRIAREAFDEALNDEEFLADALSRFGN